MSIVFYKFISFHPFKTDLSDGVEFVLYDRFFLDEYIPQAKRS